MRTGRLILYAPRAHKGQTFAGAKVHVLPSQSMTLKEILKRFVRNEQLPVAHEGVYEERFGDLEKLARKDIVEQMEVVETLRAGNESRKKRKKVDGAQAPPAAPAPADAPAPPPPVPPKPTP